MCYWSQESDVGEVPGSHDANNAERLRFDIALAWTNHHWGVNYDLLGPLFEILNRVFDFDLGAVNLSELGVERPTAEILFNSGRELLFHVLKTLL